MGLFQRREQSPGAAGATACQTCPTSCFGEKKPLGTSFEKLPLEVQQAFERLRGHIVEVDRHLRGGREGAAQEEKARAVQSVQHIVGLMLERGLLDEARMDLLASTVSNMVGAHASSELVRRFIDRE